MPWWCTSLQHIHTQPPHRPTDTRMYAMCTRWLCRVWCEGKRNRECAPTKNTLTMHVIQSFVHSFACPLLHTLAVCLPARSVARSPAHSFAHSLTHSFVFCLWGFYSSLYSCLCSLFYVYLCVRACVCMAPLLSLDTLLVVVIPFYHYVNSESKRRMKEESWYSVLIHTNTHLSLRWCLTQQNRRTVIMK